VVDVLVSEAAAEGRTPHLPNLSAEDIELPDAAAPAEGPAMAHVEEILAFYRDNAGAPHAFSDVVATVGADRPEELIAAMHALEALGMVKRAITEGPEDSPWPTYQWAGSAVV
jgi:hypothetical protein